MTKPLRHTLAFLIAALQALAASAVCTTDSVTSVVTDFTREIILPDNDTPDASDSPLRVDERPDQRVDERLDAANLPGEGSDTSVYTDSLPPTVVTAPGYTVEGKKIFNPDPTKACWLSALCPGLGQIYNRSFWKLPIIVAGYMGLGYGTSWNARMYGDYKTAYADLMDDDPDTKSYLDFFPPTVTEDSLDKAWLQRTLKSRKDFYRRNRDLCIIACVGVYLLCMVDAYVDASLSHFDISPNLSMDVAPTITTSPVNNKPGIALMWALTF